MPLVTPPTPAPSSTRVTSSETHESSAAAGKRGPASPPPPTPPPTNGTLTPTSPAPSARATPATEPSASGSSSGGSLPRGEMAHAVESIDKLRAAVSKLEQMRRVRSLFSPASSLESDDDKASFILLASRYLTSDVEDRIDWSKIQQPTHEMVVPYDSL
ncbi:hypothetical protein E2562_001642, partial [Oryza meyeriana var. granulata]